MKDRLLRFLNMENMTSAQLADAIGIQRSTVSHLLSGRNNPSYDFIVRLLTQYKYLNADWLLTGNGPMYRQKDENMMDLFSSSSSDTSSLPRRSGDMQHTIPQPDADESSPDNNRSNPNMNSSGDTMPDAGYPSFQRNMKSKPIDRIVIFYADHTLEEYRPA